MRIGRSFPVRTRRGPFIRSTSFSINLSSGLSFTGPTNPADILYVVLNAVLSFTSPTLVKNTNRLVNSGLSFVGAVSKLAKRFFAGGQSFAGSLASGLLHVANFVSLSGTLSFAGGMVRQTIKALPAGLSFAGSAVRSVMHQIGATISPTGILPKMTNFPLVSAALSLVGTLIQGRLRIQSLLANLSFVGSASRITRRGTGATLSFAGSVRKQPQRAFTAALSFIGSIPQQGHVKSFNDAALSFTGSSTKTLSRALTGGLSWVGQIPLILSKNVTGVLSFTGQTLIKQVLHIIQQAGLSFLGRSTKTESRGLMGTLVFAGTMRRNVSRGLSAGLSYTGAMFRGLRRTLAGGLSLTGNGAKYLQRGLSSSLISTGASVGTLVRTVRRGFFAGGLSFTGNTTRTTKRPLLGAVLSFLGASTQKQTLWAHPAIANLNFTTHFEAVPGVDTLYAPVDPTYLGVYPDEILVSMLDGYYLLVPAPSANPQVAPNEPMRTK